MNNEHILIKTMRNTIQEHNMLRQNDRIIVGVSGGADSVSLLMALNGFVSEYNLDLIVCHVNHKMRPEAAEMDQEFVYNLCKRLGVPCYIKEARVEDLAEEWGMSDEEAGRKVRYDFFNEIAGKNGKIATAHNKNDNAETVVMRFMRGTGLHGLTGIPYQRDNIIRPLLDVSRDEIESYLSYINQTHVTDATNFLPMYTRNKIRLNMIPAIKKDFNPNFVETLANNIANYRDEDDYLNERAMEVVDGYFEFENENYLWMSKNILTDRHIAPVKRAIKIAFSKKFDIELSSQSINNIVELINKHNGTKMSVIGEIVASVQHSGIVFQEGAADKMMVEFNLRTTDITDSVVFHTNNMSIEYIATNAENVVNDATTFYYPVDLCEHGFKFRTRRDGDVVAIAPGIRKKLKKFFVDEKIDAATRDEYWLLVNENNEVVWIPGLFGGRLSNEQRSGEMIKFTLKQRA